MIVAVKRTECTVDEVKLLALVSHRHVIKMFGACIVDPSQSFIVTEYCEDGSLFSVLESTELVASRKLDWSCQVFCRTQITIHIAN